MALVDDFAQRPNDVRFGCKIHGEVRVIPVAQHHQALEIFALAVNLFGSVFAAVAAEFTGAHLVADLANLFFDFEFDRQTMAVPARYIRGIKAAHGARLDDHVFQNLVYRVADMNLAVGVWRAIVQYKLVTPGTGSTNLLVQPHALPARQHVRFTLGQIATHRKFGIRQIQGRFVLAVHFIVHNGSLLRNSIRSW